MPPLCWRGSFWVLPPHRVLCQAGQAWSPLTQQHASAACQQLLRLPSAAIERYLLQVRLEVSAVDLWQARATLNPQPDSGTGSECAGAECAAPVQLCTLAPPRFSTCRSAESLVCCCWVCLQYVYLAAAKPGGVLEHTIEQLCSTSFTLAIKVNPCGVLNPCVALRYQPAEMQWWAAGLLQQGEPGRPLSMTIEFACRRTQPVHLIPCDGSASWLL
jgi:hypothetical protein